MWRRILGVLAGLVAWAIVATLLNFGLRAVLPGYAKAEPSFAFTLPMEIGRLALAVLASLAAGAAVRAVAPSSRLAPWALGFVMLMLFLPVHIGIGARLPLWYHLFFLITLAPLVALGAELGPPIRSGRNAGQGFEAKGSPH